MKRDAYKIQRDRKNEREDLSISITSEELENAIGNMKDHKAVGLDDIFTEEIRHFGQITKTWILNLFNNIRLTQKIPKIWRKTKIITLPKPGKPLQTQNILDLFHYGVIFTKFSKEFYSIDQSHLWMKS